MVPNKNKKHVDNDILIKFAILRKTFKKSDILINFVYLSKSMENSFLAIFATLSKHMEKTDI